MAKLQRDMRSAGLLTKSFRLGIPDNNTLAAYENLLGIAERMGLNPQDALDRIRASGMVDEEGAGQVRRRAPLVVQLSNPEDIRAVFQKAATAVIGRRVDDHEADHFVQFLQAQERSAQQRAYTLEGGEQGGTVVQPPNTQAAAVERLRRQHPGEAFAEDAGARLAVWEDLLSTSSARAGRVRSGGRARG